MKNDLLHSSPHTFRLGRWVRGAASYAALVGGLASAAWLSAKMDTLPQPHLGLWDLQKIPLVVLDTRNLRFRPSFALSTLPYSFPLFTSFSSFSSFSFLLL
ncbi:MAG: hypothetical protein V4599_09120, partial [Verrucomicrobiota bacterium]